jgi:hypothetical protein
MLDRLFAPLRNSVNVALSNDIIKYIIITFSFPSSLALKYACIKWLLTPPVQSVLWNMYWPSDEGARSMQKNKGLIFHSTDRTSEVNNRFIIWLNWVFNLSICFSCELNRLSTVSLSNNIRQPFMLNQKQFGYLKFLSVNHNWKFKKQKCFLFAKQKFPAR